MARILRHAPQFEVLTARETRHAHALIKIVDEPLVWADHGRAIWFEVPVGFVFDSASVPNLLYPALDATPLDLVIPGACHDYLYRKDAQLIEVPGGGLRAVGRDEADEVMRDVCQYVGGDWGDRQKIFFALRVAGWASFRKKKVGWSPRRKRGRAARKGRSRRRPAGARSGR